MTLKNLTEYSIIELLRLQSASLEELRYRKVLRSANKPTGDLAEYLFCKAFNWEISNNSQNGYDARNAHGHRYQIKGRQVIKNNAGERQLSAIRNLKDQKFDFIAGVLFHKDYSVFRAAIIPYKTILDSDPSYSAHDNKHIFFLKDSVWKLQGVEDVTENLVKASETLAIQPQSK